MLNNWPGCQNILCIRADNLGDLLMSSPAILALKETFSCKITVLTSSMATGIARFIPQIDDVITYDLPWVKANETVPPENFLTIIDLLKEKQFDAAIIFTVYSQSSMPAAMLAYMAQIPLRLAYCRENPYGLLTDWLPEVEPYEMVRHQVRRDLDLVSSIGAKSSDEKISIVLPYHVWPHVEAKLQKAGIDINKPWIILHAGVSEIKREYPVPLWVITGKKLVGDLNQQVLLTGVQSEKSLTDHLESQIGRGAFSLGGLFTLEEFLVLINHASLVISVNTGTIHIAAATSTPVLVLYALTNPQHLPWKVPGKVLLFDIPKELRSKNQVIKYVHENLIIPIVDMASPDDVLAAARQLLQEGRNGKVLPEVIPLRKKVEQPTS
ncbi:MAG: glycosyltransferase family 9 protein [Chitinophagaceae bacterium]